MGPSPHHLNPALHLGSTARIQRDIRADCLCSCKLHCSRAECVLLSPFATRGFWGLSPPKRSSKPPKLQYETLLISWDFVKFWSVKPLPHKPQVPPQKRKAPYWKTFWRRTWFYSLVFTCSLILQLWLLGRGFDCILRLHFNLERLYFEVNRMTY